VLIVVRSNDPYPSRRKESIVANGRSRRVTIGFEGGEDPEPAFRILDALRARGALATFFLDGDWAQTCPDVVRRIAAEGHELGNHGHGHPDWTTLDDDGVRENLARVEALAVDLVGGTTKPWVLPPRAAIDDRVRAIIASEGYRAVNPYPLDSRAWPDGSAAAIHERAMADFEVGANVITIHTGREATADALGRILEDLVRRAIAVTTLSGLGEPPRYPERRIEPAIQA
jgi:peptidoglycan/xylan/chitin deacetylase (PgdA/CDA1 family)